MAETNIQLFEYEKEIVEALRADFPPEAVQVKKKFKNNVTGKTTILTGIKPQYIIERLNNVLTHTGWDYQVVEKGIEGEEVWVLGRLTIYAPVVSSNNLNSPITRIVLTTKEQFGTSSYSKNMPIGDAYKSAATNAMEKCASLLDIAHQAYKGLLKVPTGTKGAETAKEADRENLLTKLSFLCSECDITKDSFKTLQNTVHNKPDAKIGDFNEDEIKAMIKHLEENKSPFPMDKNDNK